MVKRFILQKEYSLEEFKNSLRKNFHFSIERIVKSYISHFAFHISNKSNNSKDI